MRSPLARIAPSRDRRRRKPRTTPSAWRTATVSAGNAETPRWLARRISVRQRGGFTVRSSEVPRSCDELSSNRAATRAAPESGRYSPRAWRLPRFASSRPPRGSFSREVPDEGAAGVAAAVHAARAAAPAWAALPVPERAEALKRWRDRILDEVSLVAETLASESGKPRHEAEVFEVVYLCELIRFACRAARRALAEETRNPLLFLTKKTRLLRKPLGVVGVIGPWNFPILNNAADCVAPLVMGNTIVLKPSEVTPLTSLLLRDLWIQAGNPPDVFRVVTGRGEAGGALVEHADGIMFTGSVATGRRVAARAGERLIPCVVELGGKSPFVVLAGADLERAASAAAWSSFIHSGQVCIRTERIYVEEPVAETFETLLVERVRALRPPGRGRAALRPARPGSRDHRPADRGRGAADRGCHGQRRAGRGRRAEKSAS